MTSLDATFEVPFDESDVEKLSRILEFRIAEIHTAMPAVVLGFHPEDATCDVKPSFRNVVINSDGTLSEELPPRLDRVPICYPRGESFRITWPLEIEDTVLLVFCERSMDQWAQSGGQVRPEPARKHDWSDAVVVPGLFPKVDSRPVPAFMSVGSLDGTTTVEIDAATGSIRVNAAQVTLGPDGSPAPAAARVGDAVTIVVADNPEFLQWIIAASSAGPSVVPPFTGTIQGTITSGSARVSSA